MAGKAVKGPRGRAKKEDDDDDDDDSDSDLFEEDGVEVNPPPSKRQKQMLLGPGSRSTGTPFRMSVLGGQLMAEKSLTPSQMKAESARKSAEARVQIMDVTASLAV